MDDLPTRLALMGVLLVLSAFFASSETAVFFLSKLQVRRLRDDDSLVGRALLHFVDHPRQLLITSLLGNNLVNIAFTTLIASTALAVGVGALGWRPATAAIAATGASTVLLLFFGEITPKTYALKNAERLARFLALPLWATAVALSPLRHLLRITVDAVGRILGVPSTTGASRVTEEEFREVIHTGQVTGGIRREEHQLIHRILALREMMAKDIMVPRPEMVCLDAETPIERAFDVARAVGHSRLPVYRGNFDNVVGVLHVKDYPNWRASPLNGLSLAEITDRRVELNPHQPNTLIRPPLFVPETKRLDALLRDFAREGTQMAVLLDEYGGTAGIVTVEDVIEEIVGEIVDEYDALLDDVEVIEDFSPDMLRREGVQLPAKLSLRTAARILRQEFPTDVADTVGGYVYSLLGRVPATGETATDGRGLEFQVVAMTGTRIQKVLVRSSAGDVMPPEIEEQSP
jgi:CBS domain containing-hemolysin-like protein